MALSQKQFIQYQNLVKALYKNRNREPFLLTPGQAEIFHAIYHPSVLRAVIRGVTRYGKSEVASIGALEAATSRREKIVIVAPSAKQAGVIMGDVIEHLFDHEYLTQMVQFEGSLERLKAEKSKQRLTFRNGSEIFLLTAEADTVSREGKMLMGFGATIVIEDESSLIPDNIHSKILRMLGDDVVRAKLIQIGNPFEENHFYQAFESPRYEKIIIKKEQAMAEGRLTQDFLDEMKESMPEMDYLIFYDCEFPRGGANDALIPWDWIQLAMSGKHHAQEGEKQAGLDVARFGRDKSAYIFRNGGFVRPAKTFSNIDTMELSGNIGKLIEEDEPEMTAVDTIGVGSGVFDRLSELGYAVSGVNVGESPTTDEAKGKFHNQRAEFYWGLRERFKPVDGFSQLSLPEDAELKEELKQLRYKYSSERKIRIEDKEEMKKRIGRSPDKADALMLSFAQVDNTSMEVF